MAMSDGRSNKALCEALYDCVCETKDPELAALAPKIKAALTDPNAIVNYDALVVLLNKAVERLQDEVLSVLAIELRGRIMAANHHSDVRDGRARSFRAMHAYGYDGVGSS
jgi:hypothetical protein